MRLTRYDKEKNKYLLPQGRTSEGKSYWRLIAEKLGEYENLGEPDEIKKKLLEVSE